MKYLASFHSRLFVIAALMLAFAACGLPPQAQATDLSVTASAVVPSALAVTRTGIAGATIAAGQLIYKDTADNRIKLADCNGASALIRTPIGLAIVSASSGQPIVYVIEDPALTLNAVAAKGVAYVLSATPGGIAPIADLATGWYPAVIGLGGSTTTAAISFKLICPVAF